MEPATEAKLADIEVRHEEVAGQMATAGSDQEKLRTLGRSYAELNEIVVPWRAYKEVRAQAQDARELSKAEADPEMAAYFADEAEGSE